MKKTVSITELLGIRYPILQGGMAQVSDYYLAAAVSSAGGAGIIASGQMSAERLEHEISGCRALTGKPFGVNLMLLQPNIEELLEVVIAQRVSFVTTGAGLIKGDRIEALKSAGIKVIPIAASVGMAKGFERSGADAVIGEGMEAGGHIGQLTTMAFIPQLVDALDIPVIAAGGIADGRGYAAALMLGASGVQVGTRFMCATECTIHPDVKARIIKAGDRDTTICYTPEGHPVRSIKNALTKEFDRCEKMGEDSVVKKSELGKGALERAMRDGDIKMGSVMAGQVAGLVSEQMTSEEIIASIRHEARDLLGQAFQEQW